jgi:hypothetical protein
VDTSESLVEAYLRHSGYTDIKYEPDGNIPPDFLVNGRIAIEVRRLNQNHATSAGVKGLEEVSIPLLLRVRKLLLSFGPSIAGESWFVFHRFSRPLPKWHLLLTSIERVLQDFIANPNRHPFDRKISENFELKVFRAGSKYSTFFVHAGNSDRQSGGWLLAEMETNLRFCVAEKAKKIASVRAKYPEWWLIFSDHIGLGLDDFDKECFRDQVSISHNFDKIVLFDPRDPTRAFEV